MRNWKWVVCLSFLVTTRLCVVGQVNGGHYERHRAPELVNISDRMTVTLIFPYTVRSVDRGSAVVLAQVPPGAPNVVQVKAEQADFPATNITVVTGDARVHVFELRYDAELPYATVHFIAPDSAMGTEGLQEGKLALAAEKVRSHVGIFLPLKQHAFGIGVKLPAIFVHDGILYFKFIFHNNTFLHYTPEQLRVTVKDKKKYKRTAYQELVKVPVYQLGSTTIVPAKSEQVVVMAFEQFTIPDKKECWLTVTEKNGGRHLRLRIKNKQLIKAKPLH